MIADAQFCPHCGAKVQDSAQEETAAGTTTASRLDKPEKPRKQSALGRILPVLIPIISFLLIAAGLAFYYVQEQNTNKEVLQLKKDAETAALKQKYKQAKELLEEALNKRPNYETLTIDLKAVEQAIQYNESFAVVSEHIKKSQFDAADKELTQLKNQLNEEHSPIFEPLQKQIKEKEVNITVGKIKTELNDLTTVDELGGKLSILASLPEQEASAVRTEIINKIVQISMDQAGQQLKEKQFSKAISTVDKGLQYAVNDEKLTALKGRIEQDQNAFEKAEQERIEQAMESAAQEDLKNKTAAAEVLELLAEVNEYGDLYVSGSVNNKATANIYSVTVYYSIYDENKSLIESGDTVVYPYLLEPGESGTFDNIHYGLHENVSVEIDNITWYLQ
jgi:cellobiose-specific phosphotransferase system component IIA